MTLKTYRLPVYSSQLDRFKSVADDFGLCILKELPVNKLSKFKRLDYLSVSIGYKGHSDLVTFAKHYTGPKNYNEIIIFGHEEVRHQIAEYFSSKLHNISYSSLLAVCEIMMMKENESIANSTNAIESKKGQLEILDDSDDSDDLDDYFDPEDGEYIQIHEHILASPPLIIKSSKKYHMGTSVIEMRKGEWIELSIDHPAGSTSTSVTLEVLKKVTKDPVTFIEQHIGLKYSHYLEWLLYGGKPRCSHIKSDGKQCLNSVSGSIQKTPKQFLALYGQNCSVHGGVKSSDVEIYLYEKNLHKDREDFIQYYTSY